MMDFCKIRMLHSFLLLIFVTLCIFSGCEKKRYVSSKLDYSISDISNLKNSRMNCSVISVAKHIDENNKVGLTFSLLLENLGEDSQCIFWEYTKDKVGEQPGFSLPPYIELQSYFEKEWMTLGDGIELKSSSYFCIPGKKRKALEFTIFIPVYQRKDLDGPLRIKLEGHRITPASWDGIIAVEFSLGKQP